MHSPLRLLVATDGSDAGHEAIVWSVEFATATGAEATVVHVVSSVGEWMLAVAQVDSNKIEEARRELLEGAWTEPFRTAGIAYRTRLLVGDPIQSVLQVADEQDADLIVVGKTGHSATDRLLLGGTANKLVHRSTRPLIVVPGGK